MKFRKIISNVALIIVLTPLAVTAPWAGTTAQAATATCTRWADHSSRTGARTILVPVASSGSEACQRGPHGAPALNATKALQLALVMCYGRDLGNSGPDGDGADGIYGAKTIAAVKAVQGILGLTKDGVYGPATHNAMKFMFSDPDEFGCALAKKV